MPAASDPNLVIAGLALGGLLIASAWRLIVWVRDAPVTPDPWDAEVEKKINEPETPEICPHCSAPQPSTAWFCQQCGRAVGPYNNMMPFVQVFSEGEVFRNGASPHLRKRPFILLGYFLIIVGTFPLFAPINLLSLLLNWNDPPDEPKLADEPNVRQ